VVDAALTRSKRDLRVTNCSVSTISHVNGNPFSLGGASFLRRSLLTRVGLPLLESDEALEAITAGGALCWRQGGHRLFFIDCG
jgi:hypothetical protein